MNIALEHFSFLMDNWFVINVNRRRTCECKWLPVLTTPPPTLQLAANIGTLAAEKHM